MMLPTGVPLGCKISKVHSRILGMERLIASCTVPLFSGSCPTPTAGGIQVQIPSETFTDPNAPMTSYNRHSWPEQEDGTAAILLAPFFPK